MADEAGGRLRCRACGAESVDPVVQYCDQCFGPLDLPPDWSPPPGGRALTPLVPLPGLATALGVGQVWAKAESANPTGSFKDRLVATAGARAVALGRRGIACSSTGNLARAVAVGGPAQGLDALVVVPESLAAAEVDRMVAHGALVARVRGDYDDVNRVTAQVGDGTGGWGWVNVDLRPWYVAGGRAVAEEVTRQHPGRPTAVVVPAASGGLAHQADVVGTRDGTDHPALCVAQPAGCAPLAAAFAEGGPVAPVRPATSLAALAMGDPPDGDAVLEAVRRDGGGVVAVDEADLERWVTRLRDAGVEAGRAGSLAVAALPALVEAGHLGPEDDVVAVVTDGPPRWPDPQPGRPAGRAVTIDARVEVLLDLLDDTDPLPPTRRSTP